MYCGPQNVRCHHAKLGRPSCLATGISAVGPKMLGATMQNLVARAASLQGSVLLVQPVRCHVLFVDYSPSLLLA